MAEKMENKEEEKMKQRKILSICNI